MADSVKAAIYHFYTDSISYWDKMTEVMRKLGFDNKHVFLLAVSRGMSKTKLFGDYSKHPRYSGNGVRADYLDPKETALLMAAHFYTTGDLVSLADDKERVNICCQYADIGVKDLYEQYSNSAISFQNDMNLEVKALLEAIQ